MMHFGSRKNILQGKEMVRDDEKERRNEVSLLHSTDI